MANMESDGLRAGSHGEHGLDQCDCPHAHCIHVTARCRDDHCQAQLSKKYTILETRVAGLQSKQHGILQEFAAFGGDVDELSAEVVGLQCGAWNVDVEEDGLCDVTEDDQVCISCQVDFVSRACIALRKQNALWDEILQSVEDDQDFRDADQEAQRVRSLEEQGALHLEGVDEVAEFKVQEGVHLHYAEEGIERAEVQVEPTLQDVKVHEEMYLGYAEEDNERQEQLIEHRQCDAHGDAVDGDLRLPSLKEEIERLEGQVELLDIDEEPHGRTTKPSGRRFWTAFGRVRGGGACICLDCLAGGRYERIMAAIEEAELYRVQLNRVLGIDSSGKSTLEVEREKIREAAARDSPYGRTGSYRGFGTGALKPRNGTANNSQPQKTGKKSKKPGLVW